MKHSSGWSSGTVQPQVNFEKEGKDMVDRRKGIERKAVQIPGHGQKKKKKYNKPFLMDYGSIEKLTQTGGTGLPEKTGGYLRS